MRAPLPLILGVLVVAPAAAHAQPEEPVMTPPRLLDFVEADYPEEARQQGLAATVELEVTLAADGTVTDATVVEPAGHGFDEAAVAAVRQFRFEPATRDGEPVPAIIRYRYVFELHEPEPTEPVEPTAPEPGRLIGQVLSTEGGAPVGGADVTVVAREGEEARHAVTDWEGRFRFEDLPPGVYSVRITAQGLGDVVHEETIHESEETETTYRLSPEVEPDPDAFGAVAEIDPPPREVVRRTIRREELTRIPGTRGDALRTVEILPGVARPPFGVGLLIVRGSSPQDTDVLLEGAPVPLLYHFGGLTSFMNSRLLDRIDFYPGNFSARYGRKMGGILEVGVRDPATDGFHGILETSLIDLSLLAEGPITDHLSLAVGARRSVIDFVFENFLPDDTIDLVAAPVYEDYQLILSWRPRPEDRIRLMLYGSRDRFKVFISEAFQDDPAVRGNASLKTTFHYLQLSWHRQLSADVQQDIDLQVGPVAGRFGLGDIFSFTGRFLQIEQRAEWRARLSPTVQVTAGLDLLMLPYEINFRGPAVGQGEGAGPLDPLAREDLVYFNRNGFSARPGFYVESDLRPFDPLQVLIGLRLDHYSEIGDWSFDPRLVGIYSITDRWRVKGGVGIFSQPPEFQESAEEIGNPALRPIHAIHTGLGVEHDITDTITVGVEGFFKRLWDRVVATENGLPPYFTNDGIGRIYGMEISGRVEPTDRFFGFVSYTLSRSERRDRPGDRWRLFDFDQTHILNIAGVYRLPRGWEIGGTLRLVSGDPDTPIVGAIYDANTDIYAPIPGDINSRRNPLFHRLDIRVEKKWTFHSWRLALFLDIQNVYNAKNREGLIYNFDYSEHTEITGLPIIPALGIRGEI